MRRQHTPPDAKLQRSHSNVNRRSRLLERNCELLSLVPTRTFIDLYGLWLLYMYMCLEMYTGMYII